MTTRIDADTERRLNRLARERKTSRSDIVRQALKQLAASTTAKEDGSVYARIADLVGCMSSGSGDLSTDTGKRYTALVKARRRR